MNHDLYIYNGLDDKDDDLYAHLYKYSAPSEMWLPWETAHLKFVCDSFGYGKGFRILLKTYGK